jgi:hypothetical protein
MTEAQIKFLNNFYEEDGYSLEEIPEMISQAHILEDKNYLVLIWRNGAYDVFLKDKDQLKYQTVN